MTQVCKHGQLARACEVCELEVEVCELEVEVGRLREVADDARNAKEEVE